MFRFAIGLVLLFANFVTAQAQIAESTIEQTARLIHNAKPGVMDTQGWAIDLLSVFHEQALAASRENVCSAIAVIAQESGFVADPSVPGLGLLAEKTLRAKMDRYPIIGQITLHFLENHPSTGASYMARIRAAKTERDLDMTYRSLVEDAGKSANLSLVVNSGLLNQMIEDRNNINTVGSMQVAVRFAIEKSRQRRFLPMTLADVYAVRDDLYTRHGGMFYGVMQLLGYDSGYSRKIFRFADYNAGRYASRNAAFQKLISALSKIKLATDGDLLLYDKDQHILSKTSNSEAALRSLIKANHLDIDNAHLRADLEKEKTDSFPATQTYLRLRDLYTRKRNEPVIFAVVPAIELNSPKIRHHMTTEIFANSVENRYQKCMAAK